MSHVVHDHTSILKFIETKWNLGAMTYRDANADNLLDCVRLRASRVRRPAVPARSGAPGRRQPLPAAAPTADEPSHATNHDDHHDHGAGTHVDQRASTTTPGGVAPASSPATAVSATPRYTG